MTDRTHQKAFTLLLLSKERTLTASERSFLDGHLGSCDACRRQAELHQVLQKSLRIPLQSPTISKQRLQTKLPELFKSIERRRMMQKTTHFVLTPIRLGIAVLLIGSLVWVFSQSLPESTPAKYEAETRISTSIPIAETPELAASRANPGLEMTPVQEICDCEPRTEVITYTVQEGDTIFGIADAFNLKPETILWGNDEKLFDNPSTLYVGMELNILPLDGAYHEWQEGDNLNEVASRFGVQPEDILNWPGNHLDRDTLGDFSRPNIQPGTMLVIPGGQRAFQLWTTPPPTPIK